MISLAPLLWRPWFIAVLKINSLSKREGAKRVDFIKNLTVNFKEWKLFLFCCTNGASFKSVLVVIILRCTVLYAARQLIERQRLQRISVDFTFSCFSSRNYLLRPLKTPLIINVCTVWNSTAWKNNFSFETLIARLRVGFTHCCLLLLQISWTFLNLSCLNSYHIPTPWTPSTAMLLPYSCTNLKTTRRKWKVHPIHFSSLYALLFTENIFCKHLDKFDL